MYPPNFGGLGSLWRLICRSPFWFAFIGLLIGVPTAVTYLFSTVDGNDGWDCCKSGVVTFWFDDGRDTVYTNAFPIMEERDLIGVVSVITNEVGAPEFMNLDQLTKLQEADWEIGSHTMSHRDLTTLSPEEVEKELTGSQVWLLEHNFPGYHLASPYGNLDDQTMELIQKYYFIHREAWPDGINTLPLSETDRYHLKVVSVESDTPVSEVKAWVDQAFSEGKWLILLFHQVGGAGQYNTTIEDFTEISEYVRSFHPKQLTLETIQGVLDQLK